MKREPNITEQQAREIVEKMGRRESYTPKSMDDLYRRIGLEPDEPGQPGNTVTEETETAMTDEPSGVVVEEAAIPQKTIPTLNLHIAKIIFLQNHCCKNYRRKTGKCLITHREHAQPSIMKHTYPVIQNAHIL